VIFVSRILLLLCKTRKRQTAIVLIILSSLYLLLRLFGVIPKDIQTVVNLMTNLLVGLTF
jgi:hypothetical protein